MIDIACHRCGKIFQDNPSDKRKYCGRACSRASQPRKHGDSKTRLYGTWCHMKTRCYCSTSKSYPYYGGRGIKVCDNWVKNYKSFKDWALLSGYRESLEIDRIDVNGNYCPENCRWVTRQQQCWNMRQKQTPKKTSKYKGVSWKPKLKKWVVQISLNGETKYCGLYTDEVEAAMAYDQAARSLHGEFCSTNFP